MNDLQDGRVAVYTAIAGGVDQLRDPEVGAKRCDFICFSDDDSLTSDRWDIRPFQDKERDPARTAKRVKILPHRYLSDYPASVWVDANLTVVGDPAGLVDEYLEESALAVFRHPDGRRSLLEEAEACIRFGKDDP